MEDEILFKKFLEEVDGFEIPERGPFECYSALYCEALNTLTYAPDCTAVNAGLEHVSAVMPLLHEYKNRVYVGVNIWGGHFKEKDWHKEPIRRIIFGVMYRELGYYSERMKWHKIPRALRMYARGLVALYLIRPWFSIGYTIAYYLKKHGPANP